MGVIDGTSLPDLTRKTGVYQVEIRAGDKRVALFTGTVYRKG